ncbi:hypothetical protein KQX54_000152 [Cotesia glomerata]|uniref:Secreted protein n=1 Tax=Cotesia glomerata TaxID=32391 RepID=A0AAV7IEW3_COTGL|nr:hypothetical protein KQX54_000152 [Cotesia glomerata]
MRLQCFFATSVAILQAFIRGYALTPERLLQHYPIPATPKTSSPTSKLLLFFEEADFPGSSPTKHSQSIQASPTITLWPERPRASSADESS